VAVQLLQFYVVHFFTHSCWWF